MRRHRVPTTVPVAMILAVTLVGAAAWYAGATADPGERVVAEVPVPPVDDVPVTPAPDPTPTDEPSPTPEDPEPTPTTPAPTADPEPSATEEPAEDEPAFDAASVQARLTELGYYVGAIDGKPGPATVAAVMAFQKVNGLQVDGVIGPQTLAALDDPVQPVLVGGPDTRVEVDLTRQVLHLIVDGQRVRTMPVSSGSGETYATTSGGTARALTPTGVFTVEREIDGLRSAPLGSLYNPKYFHRGWAIHGSPSVPAYPASHGCIRVTIADSEWLFDRVPIGTTVIVHGGTHVFSPEGVDAAPVATVDAGA